MHRRRRRAQGSREHRTIGTVESVPDTVRSIMLFAAAAVLEIGGAWLIWQGVREHRGIAWIGAGAVALAGYGFVATFQPDPNFGRILAAYGGVFVVGSLAWGVIADGFRPDRYDVIGAAVCLIGVAVIMYSPRPT
jgi:small multidrug resistance family-3 protein